MSGFDESRRLDAVFARMQRFVTDGELAGAALAVAIGGEQVAEWYAGQAAPGRSANAETLWPLASISKTYTAAAVMALVERGDLTLSLPVRALLADFEGAGREGIRLGHLLTHTAGLIYESPHMEDLLRQQAPLAAIVAEGCAYPLLFPPGTRHSYSDLGYALAGQMAEVAAGQPFPEVARSLVLEPSGLPETFLPPPPSDYGRVAHVLDSLAYGSEGAMYNTPYALALAHPAFGVVASVRDLLRFGLLFAPHGRHRILSEAMIRAMTSDRTGGLTLDGPHRIFPYSPEAYGLGFCVGHRSGMAGDDLVSPLSFGHDGASGCVLLVDPVADLTIACVSNRHLRTDPDRWSFRLSSLVNGVMAALTRRPT
jgi:serine-type D-Ala-D-Ala carboxypeptidase